MSRKLTLHSTERNSAMEMLRIVAMSMILIYHFSLHASILYETSVICKSVVLSMLLGGVNLFVMISGYFGIKVRLPGFLNLYVLIVIYIALNILLNFLAGMHNNWMDMVKGVLFPFSCGGYWYLSAYIGLYFTAPILNPALSGISLVQLRKTVLLFAFFNIISCGMLGNLCNTNGFTYMQFVFMYVVGHWMSREDLCKFSARMFLSIAVFVGIVEFLIMCALEFGLHHSSGYFMRYNNIFVVIQTVCILGVFAKLNFRNRIVNKIALASLGCYMLQDGLFGYKVLYPFLIGESELSYYVFAFFSLWIVSYMVVSFKRWCLDPIIYRVVAYVNSLNLLSKYRL